MNPIRPIILAVSLLCASLAPQVAHAVTPISPRATSREAPASRAPLATGLLALGAAGESSPPANASEDATLAQREQASPELRNFHGGRVYVYLGGGATLILVLILLLILL